MADILVRNVDDRVAKALRKMAKADGRSLSGFLRNHYAELIGMPAGRTGLAGRKYPALAAPNREGAEDSPDIIARRREALAQLARLRAELKPGGEDAVTLVDRSRDESLRDI